MKMKKIGILLLLAVFLVSCDRSILIRYTIKNNCDDAIFVDITSSQSSHLQNFSINPNEEFLMFSEGGLNGVDTWIIKYAFESKEIHITKNSKEANVNYLDENLWQVTSDSDTWTLCLPVNPEDFE
jgi:PBP1b-binding outer membrane lipoprotein LpoB